MTENPFGSTAYDVANDALMMRTTHALVLIVEGTSDCALLERQVNRAAIGLVIATGKPTALRAALVLDEQNCDDRIRVLVDRDSEGGFDGRVITTGARDLDVEVLMAGTVLERVRSVFAKDAFDGDVVALQKHIAWVAAPLSALVLVSLSAVPGLKATGIKLSGQRIDDGLSSRVAATVRQAISKSKITLSLSEAEICAVVEKAAMDLVDSLCNHQGHAVHEAIAFVVSQGNPEMIQRAACNCIYPSEFQETVTGQTLAAWSDGFGLRPWLGPGFHAA